MSKIMGKKTKSFFLLAAFFISVFSFCNPQSNAQNRAEQFLQKSQTKVGQNNSANLDHIGDFTLANHQSRSDTPLTSKPGVLPNSQLAGLRYSKTTIGGRQTITNGKYTVNPASMDAHIPGSSLPNKSVFRSDIGTTGAYDVTIDAAKYADVNNLWKASSPGQFANKARVPVNTNVGTHGNTGLQTRFVNVYRTKDGKIHATPASP